MEKHGVDLQTRKKKTNCDVNTSRESVKKSTLGTSLDDEMHVLNITNKDEAYGEQVGSNIGCWLVMVFSLISIASTCFYARCNGIPLF